MINKKLLNFNPKSKKFIGLAVLFQWMSLLANITIIIFISNFIQSVFNAVISSQQIVQLALITCFCIAIRYVLTITAVKMGYYASKDIKSILRNKIYKKVIAFGPSYNQKISTSEIVQITVDGASQLENYFGLYVPQLFYSILAPITLFFTLFKISLLASIILLCCVPLIPISIALVQTWAKKLLSKYWNQYTALGDIFLENLQGLTTLKIYNADKKKNEEMNHQAEEFRKITMKVLTMQLNSITIMDIFAYGGSALGIIIALFQLYNGYIDIKGALLITLLSAEFFLPMRLLGSYFHIAMNGMAAWEKIDKFLSLPDDDNRLKSPLQATSIHISTENLEFSYDESRPILCNINIEIPAQGLVAIVGESGCGKSTLGNLVTGKIDNFKGTIKINHKDISSITAESLMQHIVTLPHNAYIFQGSVRDNLAMAAPLASDKDMIEALTSARLWHEIESIGGLTLMLREKGSNLSGGQCQRLAFARGLLHDGGFYLFDEATSNIDAESENFMIQEIYKLAQRKSVMMISHRLANVTKANIIYVMKNGQIIAKGTHHQLLEECLHYKHLWEVQQQLENLGKEVK